MPLKPMESARLSVPADETQVEQVLDFVEAFATQVGFDGKALGHIRLASEEAVVNVVHYAYTASRGASGDVGDLVVVLSPIAPDGNEPANASPVGMVIELSDTGVAFDPLSRPPPDISAPAMERPIGGLGVHLIRKLMDGLEYRREDNRNILTMTKRFSPHRL